MIYGKQWQQESKQKKSIIIIMIIIIIIMIIFIVIIIVGGGLFAATKIGLSGAINRLDLQNLHTHTHTPFYQTSQPSLFSTFFVQLTSRPFLNNILYIISLVYLLSSSFSPHHVPAEITLIPSKLVDPTAISHHGQR